MDSTRSNQRSLKLVMLMFVAVSMSGCSLFTGLRAVPVNRVPKEFLARPKEDAVQISISRLKQDPPENYRLGAGDVLGIYIENVLGEEGETPPVHFPESGDQPPALGFPVPVREDGTVSLPYIPAVDVQNKTLIEATDLITNEYISRQILQPEQSKIIVTLIRRREVRVTVIREEAGGQDGVLKRGTGQTVDLPAYENDVLHALNLTGGLPGLDAKNELLIIKSGHAEGEARDQLASMMLACQQNELFQCPVDLPDAEGTVRVPIRYFPESPPQFSQEDVILENGDIIYIPARDSEKFYTGGTLNGGEHVLPRDYSLDVIEAIALVGGTIGGTGTGLSGQQGGQGGFGGGGGLGGGQCQPSDLVVLRELPCGGHLPIKIDLKKALTDPSQRILVQPGDTLILRYTLEEDLINFVRSIVSVNFLLNGFNGTGF